MQRLDPKAVWLFFLYSLFSTAILLIPIIIAYSILGVNIFFQQAEINAILEFVAQNSLWFILVPLLFVILNYIYAQLTYHFYRYQLSPDGFKKEHGIIWKKYVTIPYERIQNVDIYRGLLARLLGLSDLHVQTAGMSTGLGSYGGGSEGRLPGLSKKVAEQLRDDLIKRTKDTHQRGL